MLGGVAEEGEEAGVEVFDVEQADGFVVEGELLPGEGFEEFLEGADAAREGDEAIAEMQRAVQLSGGSPTIIASLARAYVASGRRIEAESY